MFLPLDDGREDTAAAAARAAADAAADGPAPDSADSVLVQAKASAAPSADAAVATEPTVAARSVCSGKNHPAASSGDDYGDVAGGDVRPRDDLERAPPLVWWVSRFVHLDASDLAHVDGRGASAGSAGAGDWRMLLLLPAQSKHTAAPSSRQPV